MARRSNNSDGSWILILIFAIACAPLVSLYFFLKRDTDSVFIGIVILVIWLIVMVCYAVGVGLQ